MKITLTNAEAVKKLDSLRELEKLNNPVPAIVGYRVVQNIYSLSSALAPYWGIRNQTIRKYANGGDTLDREANPEVFEACTKELHDIDGLEISVEVSTFPFSLIAESRFPLSVYFALDFMIEKGEG